MKAQRTFLYGITLAAGLCMSSPAVAVIMDGKAVEDAARLIGVGIPFLVCLFGLGFYLFCSGRPMHEKVTMLAIYNLLALILALIILPGELGWSWLAVWIAPLAAVIAYTFVFPIAPASDTAPEPAPLDTTPRRLFSD
ncbi:hypothetical protein F2P45_03175 [Massilia sp. CCM 8733]|uniref:Uncharacterized protein n=1 Tax=Massilia mucilaginosa TaxID=2609282 RepID=A0ABX0NML0_9BURK|nr:hypothetical protein [Massilia mucilaginosa]NHZ88039.1 hypothetical protein [Massilia mucilaginosa]